jgi:hypothetical protein
MILPLTLDFPFLLSLVLEKKSVFKLIKSSSAELLDLSQLKDPDLESSICERSKSSAEAQQMKI